MNNTAEQYQREAEAQMRQMKAEQAWTRSLIFEISLLRFGGYQYRAIAEKLNKDERFQVNGKPWTVEALYEFNRKFKRQFREAGGRGRFAMEHRQIAREVYVSQSQR